MPQVTGPTNLRQSQGQNVLGRTQWASVEARVAAKIGSDLADLPKDRHPARAALLTVVKQQLARERGTQEDRHAGKRVWTVLLHLLPSPGLVSKFRTPILGNPPARR